MTTSKTIAGLIGPTLVAIAIGMLLNFGSLRALAKLVSRDPALIFVSGILLFVAERLNRAFTLTLRALSLVDRADPVCEIVAQKVIEIDAAGTHEPDEIAKLAAKQLGFS